MSKEDELKDILGQAAKDIGRLQANPRTWLSWMVYLLGQLEGQATNENAANKDAFVGMLSSLQDEIRNRLRTGGWH
jgi:hypothetical protein